MLAGEGAEVPRARRGGGRENTPQRRKEEATDRCKCVNNDVTEIKDNFYLMGLGCFAFFPAYSQVYSDAGRCPSCQVTCPASCAGTMGPGTEVRGI